MSDLDIKRIEILQGIIARMAQNSFAIKDSDRAFAFLAFYPAVAFWGLDAYYLMQERLFRDLSKLRTEAGKEFQFTTKSTARSPRLV